MNKQNENRLMRTKNRLPEGQVVKGQVEKVRRGNIINNTVITLHGYEYLLDVVW